MNTDIPTNSLPKAYSPAEAEAKWYPRWIERGLFRTTDASAKPAYSVLMPPPNVTGILHLGHVLNHTIQDIYIRWHRMRGEESCWFPGTDHAGIATESKVVQQLAKEGVKRHDLGREKFVERVWQWKEQYGGIIFQQLQRLGNSSDWDRNMFTMDESSYKAVQEVFIQLFDEGLIYRGKRIINWSPVAQSALSDEEVQFREVKEFMYTLRYEFEGNDTIEIKRTVKDEDGSERVVAERVNYLAVATARPETLFGDVAVAVNPKDERYKHLVGKRVRVPLAGQLVPIIADEYADPEFGTGCVKITPAHDPNDFLVGERHSLELINTINPDGTMNELAGAFNGLDRFKARKAMVDKLKELDLVEEIKDYTHNVGFSERGGEPVEPYLSDQWFVKMKPLAEPALKVVQNGDIRFFPDHWVKTYEHWMTNIKDWCISRQLWWGIRIPVYYVPDGNGGERPVAARSETEARHKAGVAADVLLRQDEDVFDTWFSSNIWPLTTMGWDGTVATESTSTMQKFLPTNLLVTGPDIIFFWVARMIMFTLKFKGVIPFRDVYFTSIIRDGKGRKLSKSLGNSPDPLQIMDKYGADALRFTIINAAPIGQDVKLAINDKTQDIEATELGRNFANKVWNAARFLMLKREEAFEGVDAMHRALSASILQPASYELSDRWILSRFHQTIEESQWHLEKYKLNDYARTMYQFIWNDFCDWYVEVVKIRLQHSNDKHYNQALVGFALSLFDGVLRLLHPIMPFITEELWQALSPRRADESICIAPVPAFQAEWAASEAVSQFERVQSLIEAVRGLRGAMNIAPSEKLPVVAATDAAGVELFRNSEPIITAMTRAASFQCGMQGSSEAAKPMGSVSAVMPNADVFVVVKDVIDVAKETARLEKERARLKNLANSTQAKLANEKFVQNAAADLVEYEREKLRTAQESLAKIQMNIQELSMS
jgi:valyl-tRNA synthetase